MLATFIPALLFAAPCGPLDLPTALVLAGRRSDEVGIKQAELAAAEVDLALARAIAFLPQSSATLVVGPDPEAHGTVIKATGNDSRSLNNLGIFERIDVTAVQPIWTWGQLSGARAAAAAGVRARGHLVDDTLSQVQLRVIQLFWGDALARKFLAITADVEKALVDVDAQIAKSLKDEDGAVSPQDRFQVALFRAELKGRKAEARRGQDLARIGLAATLALPRDDLRLEEADLVAPKPKPEDSANLLETARGRAELGRPDLLALGAAIEAKKAEVRIKEGALFPTLFVAGTFTYSYAYNRDIQYNPWVSDPFNALSVGAVVGLRQDLGIPALLEQRRKAQAELRGLERQYDGLRRLIDTQVETAAAELTAARVRVDAGQEALVAGKSWFRAAGLDFQAGVGDAKALLIAYRGYVESQVNAAQASYDLLVATARFDQASAKPLVGAAGGVSSAFTNFGYAGSGSAGLGLEGDVRCPSP